MADNVHTQTRDLPPLSLRASFQPATVNREKRTVELVWSTGARVKRGFWEPYWEELSLDPKHVRMGRLNNGAPFLRDHGSMWGGATIDDVLAVVESARLERNEAIAVVRFPKEGKDKRADDVFDKIEDGILQNVSVGYRVHRLVKVEESEGEIPVMRAEDWEPFEISAVAMGADDGAGFRSASPSVHNSCQFITRGEVPQKETPRMDPETPAVPVPPVVLPVAPDVEKIRAEEREKERTRSAEIRRTVRAAQLPDEMADKLIADGATVDAARAQVIDELGKRTVPLNSHPRIETAESERDKRVRGVTAMVIMRSGAAGMIQRARKSERFGDQFKDVATDPGEFRGMTLIELARDTLERAGVKTRGMDKMEIARRALTFRSAPGQSTSDFAVLFDNALHKMLLGAYATAPDTWRLWCATDTVSDFLDHPRYRNGSFGIADLLAEGAEYKRKQIPDGFKVAISTQTYGNKIALTRQAIINDDMGAFAGLATEFGSMFGLTLEVLAYALLTANSGLGATFSGNAFFHSSNSNINTTGSALAVDGIDADRHVMARQKDPSGNRYIALNPQVLVVATELGGTARVVNSMEFDGKDYKSQVPNKVRGLFQTVVDTPYLSGTRRYLFADPSIYPAFKMVFLEGGEAPVLESQESWDIDGTEWKVRFDAKALPFDPKVVVTNAGQ